MFGHSDYYGGGLRTDLFLIKLPPLGPRDQIARNGFANLVVSAGPTRDSAVNARLRFGYAENGPPGSFFCAYNRKETCVSNPNPTAANPYYFASDSGQTLANCSERLQADSSRDSGPCRILRHRSTGFVRDSTEDQSDPGCRCALT